MCQPGQVRQDCLCHVRVIPVPVISEREITRVHRASRHLSSPQSRLAVLGRKVVSSAAVLPRAPAPSRSPAGLACCCCCRHARSQSQSQSQHALILTHSRVIHSFTHLTSLTLSTYAALTTAHYTIGNQLFFVTRGTDRE